MLEKPPEDIVDAQENNKWIAEEINPEFLFEAQMTKLRLLNFGHIIQKPSFDNSTMLGKLEGKRKKENNQHQDGSTQFTLAVGVHHWKT